MFKYLNSSIYYSSGTSVELFTFGVTIIEEFTLKILAPKKNSQVKSITTNAIP